MDARWDDLRVFLAVTREDSFSGAARALGVEQSTVSRRIGALEDALGGLLFDRTTQGPALTRLGRTRQAAWDLRLATAAAPRCAVTAFYRLLVWVKRDVPPKQLRTQLRRVTGLGFVTWNQRNWKPSRYPELKPLLGRPEFKALVGESEPR